MGRAWVVVGAGEDQKLLHGPARIAQPVSLEIDEPVPKVSIDSTLKFRFSWDANTRQHAGSLRRMNALYCISSKGFLQWYPCTKLRLIQKPMNETSLREERWPAGLFFGDLLTSGTWSHSIAQPDGTWPLNPMGLNSRPQNLLKPT